MIHKTLQPVALTFLFIFALSFTAFAEDLTISLDKETLTWGETFTLEIETENPLERPMRAGITVSFSSPVLVFQKDKETTIYNEGAPVFGAWHLCCVMTRDLMIENWYTRWPAHTNRKMTLEVFPLDTGVLKISARAAFLISARRREVVNIPEQSPHLDQQDYPAHIRNVLVNQTEYESLARVQQLLRYRSQNQSSPFFLPKMQHSIDTQAEGELWSFVLNVMKNPYKLAQEPMFRQALSYTLVALEKPFEKKEETEEQKRQKRAEQEAEKFLTNQKGGPNIIRLMRAEKDIQFIPSQKEDVVTIRYKNGKYDFTKDDQIVLNLAQKIVELKPHSPYIRKPEPISQTSYRILIRTLTESNGKSPSTITPQEQKTTE